jgi:RHS repeat-associated protein
VKTATDASGITRTYDYNTLNDITKISYPDGRYVSTAYSSVFPHQVTGITDRGGKTTQYVYDTAKNLTRIVNPAGGITAFAYDANGNKTQLIDPKGQVTSFAYDKDNRLVKKTFADGTIASYTHDAAGRLASSTGASNRSIYYNFDLKDNLAGISYSIDLVNPANNTYPVAFTYDPYQRRTTMQDESGTTAYGYDADSRVTSVDGPLANDTLTFQYDGKGRTAGYSLQQGQSVSYTYDALDRMTSIQGSAGVFSYTYLGASPLIQRLTRPNGSYTEYQYDALNRLILVVNKKSSGETISQYGYAYNAQDRRASETIMDGAPIASFVSQMTAYSYNNVNELLGSTNPAKAFSYDLDGNTTRWDSPDGKTLAGIYDSGNRLTSVGYEIIAGMTYESYQTTYAYRGDGMVAKKEEEYTKIVNYPAVEYYKNQVKYIGYGLLPLQERDTNNSVLREYTWGKNIGGGIGGLLSMNQGGQNYFYLYDGKGNVTAVIDALQNVVATYAYDSFGNILSKSSVLDQPYQFSTKPYDDKTGLSYFGYRFYAPASGRWMTRDPLGEAAGPNLYEFVKNDPINRYDPTGLEDGFCGQGEEPVETRIDPGDEGAYTTWTCMPEKGTWQKILDWLDSFQDRGETGPDRAQSHQCRKTAGVSWFPNIDWSGQYK